LINNPARGTVNREGLSVPVGETAGREATDEHLPHP
jgi:hypothetical protein